MEKVFNNNQQMDIPMLVERHWEQSSPMGDWKNINDDMPMMTRFVSNYYNAKASVGNKLAYYNDIMSSFADMNKMNGIATDRLRSLPPQVVDIVKELTYDTINTRGNNSMTCFKEELRREFVQSQYMATGRSVPVGDQIAEFDLGVSGVTPQQLIQMISNMTSLTPFKRLFKGVDEDVMRDVLKMSVLLKSADPTIYNTFRKLLQVLESAEIFVEILENLQRGAQSLAASQSVGAAVGSVGVNTSIIQDSESAGGSIAEQQQDILNIANVMAPFGQQVPNRVTEVLMKYSNPVDLQDIKNILGNTVIDMKNPSKYAIALSTTFGMTEPPQILSTCPKNISSAMFYIAKIFADSKSGGNADTGLTAMAFTHITGLPVKVIDKYRYGLREAILCDMVTNSANATNVLGRMTQMQDLVKFSNEMLSRKRSNTPILTKANLLNYIKSVSAMQVNSQLSINDIDNFMKTHMCILPETPFKQQLANEIIEVIKMI